MAFEDVMTLIRTGIIGGGLVTQVEHLPNLLRLRSEFQVMALADPSLKTRSHVAGTWGIKTVATLEELWQEKLDAVVIGTPDPLHSPIAIAALERGLHVFCEKPLCYSTEDADEIILARDRANRVVQVGYTKRFDPAYEILKNRVADLGLKLRYVSVEVNNLSFRPSTGHHRPPEGGETPEPMMERTVSLQATQIARTTIKPPANAQAKGFTDLFLSTIIHDVNLVHGLLDAMELATGEVIGAAWLAGGAGGHAVVRIKPSDALWSITHIEMPQCSDHLERISLVFDDRIFELQIPASYIDHQPTKLIERRSSGREAEAILRQTSNREVFVEELKAWRRAMVEGEAVRNTAEAARRDLELLTRLGREVKFR
jgi:predicted dehydrogenase